MTVVHDALRAFLTLLLAVQRTEGSTAAGIVKRACSRTLDPRELEELLPVDLLREELKRSGATIEVEDHGAGTRGGEKPPTRTVGEIVRRAATGTAWSRVLFRPARDLKPRSVLEMGTNLGLGAATLSSALRLNGSGRLVTIEGDPTLAKMARNHLSSLGFGEIAEVVEGRFSRVIEGVCERSGPFDLVFVDGHHDEAATVEYVHLLSGHLALGAVLILDDVEPGRPVWRAFRRLRADFPEWTPLYFVKYGVFCLPQTGSSSSSFVVA